MPQYKMKTFGKHALCHKGAPNLRVLFFCVLCHVIVSCLLTELLETVSAGNFQTKQLPSFQKDFYAWCEYDATRV